MADQRQSVVFIDLDHTLLEGPFDSVVFPQVLGELSRKTGLGVEKLLAQVRLENQSRQLNPDVSPVMAMDWDDIFSQVAGRLGVQLQASAVEIVRAHPGVPYSSLHPGALETLARLSSAGPRRALVLATKGLLKYQLPVLEALGLLPFFDEVLTPDSSQALKTSLAFYGTWPHHTKLQIMVGDTYEDDVAPAHQFGFKTVWRTEPVSAVSQAGDPFSRSEVISNGASGPAVRPDAIIFSLSELPPVIDRLEYDALHT